MPEFSDMRIDFWCAAASQVGLLRSSKLFPEAPMSSAWNTQSGALSRPKVSGLLWNVWDHNDFISWSAKGIIYGIDDEFYKQACF